MKTAKETAIVIADSYLGLGWRDCEKESPLSRQIESSLRDYEVRIKALQDALRSVLVAYSDIPLPIELRGRLRAILEDSETNA